MHGYDTVLKTLLQSSRNSILERIIGARIARWLNPEFPEVQQTRADLLGETADLRVIHVELQSRNDAEMPLRMAEYALRIWRMTKRFPEQYVLYVGNEEMRMPSEFTGPGFLCRYEIIDIRTLDEEALLASPLAGDNILAILARHKDRRDTIRRILARIATLESGARDTAFKKLMLLAGLRKLGDSIRTEVKYMPILDDIMDHDVIGPTFREGQQQGRQEGRQEGVQEGELTILRRLIGRRFGTPPPWVDERLAKLSIPELEDVSLRLFDAKSIDELFSHLL
jgi:predicted transposase YdaD